MSNKYRPAQIFIKPTKFTVHHIHRVSLQILLFPSIISLHLHTASLWESGSSKPINPSGRKKSRNVAPLGNFTFVLHKTHRVTPREVDDSSQLHLVSRVAFQGEWAEHLQLVQSYDPIQSKPVLHLISSPYACARCVLCSEEHRDQPIFSQRKRVTMGGPNSLRPIPHPYPNQEAASPHYQVKERRPRQIWYSSILGMTGWRRREGSVRL